MKSTVVLNLFFIAGVVQCLSRDQKNFLRRRKEFCLDQTLADPAVIDSLESRDYKIQLHKSDLDRFTHCLLTRAQELDQPVDDRELLKIKPIPGPEPSDGRTMDVPL